ncbi:MAG: nucleotide exchange factor GrpE [Verrucomicrobiota bacterium JB023]|nr:nucleotide exchange factor GrpE [Verrucomicrobiota bacterium JB023]
MKEPVEQEEKAPETAAPDGEAAAPSSEPQAEASSEAPEITEQEEELDPMEKLEEEMNKWRDEALRRAAELDNYRKRMVRELEEGRKYSNQRLLGELLPVLDNFSMGMMMAEKEQGSMLYQGMAMVQGQITEFLTSQGVTVMEVDAGSPFDPNLHDAVSQEETSEVEDGAVLRVVRKGYQLGDRLLRPANVVVAKAPSAEGSEQEGAES